jgi:hypothetical protein
MIRAMVKVLPEQHLIVLARPDAGGQLLDRLGLVAGGRILADQPEPAAALALLRPHRPVRRP